MVWIHIITGDTDGHNELVGQFNANGNTACAHSGGELKPSLDSTQPYRQILDEDFLAY